MRIDNDYDTDSIERYRRSVGEDEGGAQPRASDLVRRAADNASASTRIDQWSANGPDTFTGRVVGRAASARVAGGAAQAGQGASTYEQLRSWYYSCGKFTEARNYDKCGTDPNPGGPAGPPLPSRLYVRQQGNADPIDRADVSQYGLGDCYLFAALAGLASTKEGRDVIRGAITENKDAVGKVVSYTVKLHEVGKPLFGPKTFKERTFEIAADEPYIAGHAIARGDGTDPKRPSTVYEVWPLVIEKAYAKLNDSYDAMAKGGYPHDAMEALTGKPATSVALDSRKYSFEQLWSDVAAGKVVVLSSKAALPKEWTPDNPYGLHESHAYVVTDVQAASDGKAMVVLHNPWNDPADEPLPIPSGALKRYFDAVDVGDPR